MSNWLKQHFTTTNWISFNYKWTIENFSLLYNESPPWKWAICSHVFSPPNNQFVEFDLHLYPKGHSEIWKDYLSVGVLVYGIPRKYEEKIGCRWKMSIEDANGDLCLTKGPDIYNLFYDEETLIYNFLKYSLLLKSPSKYLPKNQLTLHFEIYLQAAGPIFNVITNHELGKSQFDCSHQITTVAHTWTIENFTDLFDENAVTPYFIQSDNFPDEQTEQFSLRLSPNGVNEESKDYVGIGIWNDNECNASVHRRISLLDVDGEECFTQERAVKIYSDNGKYFKFNRATILDNSNGLVEDNRLRIYCEMSYVMDNKPKTTNKTRMLDTVHKSESSIDVAQKAFQFVSHKWTLHQPSALRLDSLNNFVNNRIDSQIFGPSTDPRLAFLLRLWPNGHDEHKKYLSLDLVNVSQHTSQVTVQYRISLLEENGQKWSGWFSQSSISKNENVRKPKFVRRSLLQDPSLFKQYLPNDKLTILCELWVIQDRKIFKRKNLDKQTASTPSPAPSVHLSNVNIHGSIFNMNSISNIEGNVDLKVDNSKQQ